MDQLLNHLRSLWLRHQFGQVRLVVYQGLVGMLRTTSGSLTYAGQFKLWRDRARARRRGISQAYGMVVNRLEQGLGLAAALKPFIPAEEYLMIFAGESSGRLVQTFEALIRSATASRDMKKGIRKAYGESIGTLFSFVVLTFISGSMVWPSLLQNIPEKYWDGWALPMIQGQMALTQNPWILLLAVVVYAAYRWSLPRWCGKSRLLAEKLLPPYGAYRDQQAATLLVVLAGLLRANLTLNQALERISSQGTTYTRWHTRAIQRREIQFAGDTARILDSGIFSETMLDQIANASASRALAETVQYMGTEALTEVVDTVTSSAQKGGAALMFVVSLLIAYYAAVQAIGSQTASDRLMQQVKTGQISVSR